MRTDAQLRTLRMDLMDRIRLAERDNIIGGVTERSTTLRGEIDTTITAFLMGRREPLERESFDVRQQRLYRVLVARLNAAIKTYEYWTGENLPILPGQTAADWYVEE